MAAKKLFRVRKEHIKEIGSTMSSLYVENAFAEGYVFVKEKSREPIYMIHSRTNRKTLEIELIENVELVEV